MNLLSIICHNDRKKFHLKINLFQILSALQPNKTDSLNSRKSLIDFSHLRDKQNCTNNKQGMHANSADKVVSNSTTTKLGVRSLGLLQDPDLNLSRLNRLNKDIRINVLRKNLLKSKTFGIVDSKESAKSHHQKENSDITLMHPGSLQSSSNSRMSCRNKTVSSSDAYTELRKLVGRDITIRTRVSRKPRIWSSLSQKKNEILLYECEIC